MPTKGVVQDPRQEHQIIHLPDRRDGGAPREVSSLLVRTTPDPRAGGIFTPEGVERIMTIQQFNSATKGLTEIVELCERLKTTKESFHTQGKGYHQKITTKKSIECHQPAKSVQSKGSNYTAKP